MLWRTGERASARFGKGLKSVLQAFIGLLVFTGFSLQASAEPMSIGFPEFDADMNFLESEAPVARFLRAATTSVLLVSFDSGRSGEGEVLTDYFRANADYTVWSVRIRSDSRRSDDDLVTAQDVIFSLARCSRDRGLAGYIGASERIEDGGRGGSELWIDLKVAKLSPGKVQSLMSQIGTCPILEARSGMIFGATLGHGANMIGTGAYRIIDYLPGKRFELHRIEGVALNKKQLPADMILRGFPDAGAALNAIRVGGVSAFYSNDEAVLAKVAKDETLLIDRCKEGPSVVYRRGVSIPCFERLGVTGIRDIG